MSANDSVLSERRATDVPRTRRLPSRAGFGPLWVAAAGANLGDGLLKTGLPIIAVTLTGSAGLVAGVTVALTLPWALLALPTGVLVDRVDRRRLVVFANVARAVALGVLLVAATSDAVSIPMLYAVAFLLGAGETLTDTATGTIVPAVVDEGRLETANARLLGTETVLNEFVGPPLAGAVVALGATCLLAGGGVLYGLVAVAMLALRGSFRAARRRGSSLGGDVREGLEFLWHHPVLRTLTLMAAVMAGAWSAWQAVLVVFAVRGPMHLSAFQYGALLTTLAVGGLLGTILAPRSQRRFGARAVIAADILGTAVLLAVPALTHSVALVAFATFVGGVGSGMWNVVVVTLRQRLVPDSLRGRVSASSRLFGWGTMPLGAALGGVLASVAGPQAVFGAGAALTILVVLPLLRLITAADLEAASGPVHARRA